MLCEKKIPSISVNDYISQNSICEMFLDCTTKVQFSIFLLHLEAIQQTIVPSAAKSCLLDKFLRDVIYS